MSEPALVLRIGERVTLCGSGWGVFVVESVRQELHGPWYKFRSERDGYSVEGYGGAGSVRARLP